MYISNPIVNDAEKDKNYYFNAPMYLRRKKNFFLMIQVMFPVEVLDFLMGWDLGNICAKAER
jgi:hypothetical protein